MKPIPATDNERRYYDALKRITRYEPVEVVRSTAGVRYGLSPEEALDSAYENIRADAMLAIKHRRRPAAPKPGGAA